MALGLYITQLVQRVGLKNAVLTINHFSPTDGETGHSEEIANAVLFNFLPYINDMQGDYVKNVSIYTRYATDGDDSYYAPVAGEGSRVSTDTAIPAYFTTASVRWRVSTLQFGPRPTPIKRGGSHIVGLMDGDVTDGQLTTDFLTTFLPPLEAAWVDPLLIDGIDYFSCIHVNPDATIDGWKIAGIDALTYGFLGHQVSRAQR